MGKYKTENYCIDNGYLRGVLDLACQFLTMVGVIVYQYYRFPESFFSLVKMYVVLKGQRLRIDYCGLRPFRSTPTNLMVFISLLNVLCIVPCINTMKNDIAI